MTQSRFTQISLDVMSFYHCYVRCVRRAFLCGDDRHTGQNFDHRKQWLVSRLKFLSYIYAVDICAYAIMSNHYHVVLRNMSTQNTPPEPKLNCIYPAAANALWELHTTQIGLVCQLNNRVDKHRSRWHGDVGPSF